MRGFSVAIFKGMKYEFKKLRIINTQVLFLKDYSGGVCKH